MCSQCSPLCPNELGWPCAIASNPIYLTHIFTKNWTGQTYVCTLASALAAAIFLFLSFLLNSHWLLPHLSFLLNPTSPSSSPSLPSMQASPSTLLLWCQCWWCTLTNQMTSVLAVHRHSQRCSGVHLMCGIAMIHPTCMHEHTRAPKCSHSLTTLIPSHAQLHTVSA